MVHQFRLDSFAIWWRCDDSQIKKIWTLILNLFQGMIRIKRFDFKWWYAWYRDVDG